jgi:hypothetical protein
MADKSYDSYADTSSAEGPDDSASEEKDDGAETSSALVPRSLFSHDCKVGDVYRVRIEKLMEDEAMITHIGGKGSTDESEDE